jgi:hypothetical protein
LQAIADENAGKADLRGGICTANENATLSTSTEYHCPMQPFVTASTAAQADGSYSVHLAMRDPFRGARARQVGSYADYERARHMGHVMVNYLRDVLTREDLIDEHHIEDARRHAESHRTV